MIIAKENTLIGFIGLGVMGKSMALNLIRAGYQLMVYNRTQDKASELLEAGAIWAESVRELAQVSNVVITMVGLPSDVEEVYFGDGGILACAQSDAYVIDMTTSQPTLAQQIYNTALEKGIHSLDAPVSGGDVGARNGELSIMVGGDVDAFNAMLPIFNELGTNIVFQGKSGSGQHTKMSNQIAIASNMIGVCEAIAYAKRVGLDPRKALQSIDKGAAGSWSLTNLAPRMIEHDYRPGFFIKHFLKDIKIALEVSESIDLYTPGLNLAFELYEKLSENGEDSSGTQALFKMYDDQVYGQFEDDNE